MDIKGRFLIKPVNLEGVRKIGDPCEFAIDYYEQGIDEIIYMDVVASLYGRNSLAELVRETIHDVFVPLTVGGGIRTLADVETMLRSGADKVAINTAAIGDPNLIDEVARNFGSQCMVLSVEAKEVKPGQWEAFTDGGREQTGREVAEWVAEAIDRGAGEVLLTSVDHEGMRKGFDIKLSQLVSPHSSVPVILSGGMGSPKHMIPAILDGRADALAIAHVLHHRQATVAELRQTLTDNNIATRPQVDPEYAK